MGADGKAESSAELYRKIRNLQRKARRMALHQPQQDTRNQAVGKRTKVTGHTGMPGLSFVDTDGGRIWIVKPPVIDGRTVSAGHKLRFGPHYGGNALRFAVRKRLSMFPRLPLSEDEWIDVVEAWQRIAPGEPFDVERLIKDRPCGTIRKVDGGVQATVMRRKEVRSASFTANAAGSLLLAKLQARAWLIERAADPLPPRPTEGLARKQDPSLRRGVRRVTFKDRRGQPCVGYEATYRRPDGRWRPRRFQAGRVASVTDADEACARAAATAFRRLWEEEQDGLHRLWSQFDWSNWRTAFARAAETLGDDPSEPADLAATAGR